MRQIEAQDQAEIAKRHNEPVEVRQPRRRWCVDVLKPELTELEYEAARRAVRECILYFPGCANSMDLVDKAWSDASIAKQIDAGRALYGLRQGVGNRCDGDRRQQFVAELIVQLSTLDEVARAFNMWRSMGRDRDRIPDQRRSAPLVRLTLISMSKYYDDCDRGAGPWLRA